MKKKMEFPDGPMKPVSKVVGLFRSSSRPGTRVLLGAVALTAVILLLPVLLWPPKIMADNDQVRTFTVDVSTELNGYFQNDVDPLEGQEVFSPGDTFVEGGTIYPGGTLARGKDDRRNIPGAIGKYKLRGTYTAKFEDFQRASMHAPNSVPDVSFATEIFTFLGDGSTVMTDGLWPNAYFSARRVVLGGTKNFGDIVGEVHEENIGENADGFCNLRVTFKLRKVDDSHGR